MVRMIRPCGTGWGGRRSTLGVRRHTPYPYAAYVYTWVVWVTSAPQPGWSTNKCMLYSVAGQGERRPWHSVGSWPNSKAAAFAGRHPGRPCRQVPVRQFSGDRHLLGRPEEHDISFRHRTIMGRAVDESGLVAAGNAVHPSNGRADRDR